MKNWFLIIIALFAFQCLANTEGNSALERLRFAEQHYASPADSLHNEEAYIAALLDVVNDPSLDRAAKMRPQLLLENAMKNRIGSVATDLELTSTHGTTQRLHEMDSVLTLVFFNDPDCDACYILKNRLDTTQVINNYINSGLLQIVAIYPFDNHELWCNTPYPSNMLNLWDENQAIDGEGLYDLPSIPLFYLLNRDKRVLMKNEASLNRVLHALERIMISSDRSTEGLLRLLYNP